MPEGFSGRGVPSVSWTTVIRSPEHSMTGEPVAAEAVTADGRKVANTIANVAARKASERLIDQESA